MTSYLHGVFKHHSRLLLFLTALCLSFIAALHLLILPRLSGGYNDDCFTSESQISSLRNLLVNVTRLLNSAGVTYWLDYGTLLAAVRDGELIPWDHDADIGYFATDSGKIGNLRKDVMSLYACVLSIIMDMHTSR